MPKINFPSALPDRPEYQERVALAMGHNPVSNDFLGIVGWAESGQFVLATGSYTRGYQDALSSRPESSLTWDILILGMLSDGTLVFPPSYRQGFRHGMQRINEIRLSVLAEGERRLFAADEAKAQQLEDLTGKLDEVMTRVQELEKQNEEFRARSDDVD